MLTLGLNFQELCLLLFQLVFGFFFLLGFTYSQYVLMNQKILLYLTGDRMFVNI